MGEQMSKRSKFDDEEYLTTFPIHGFSPQMKLTVSRWKANGATLKYYVASDCVEADFKVK